MNQYISIDHLGQHRVRLLRMVDNREHIAYCTHRYEGRNWPCYKTQNPATGYWVGDCIFCSIYNALSQIIEGKVKPENWRPKVEGRDYLSNIARNIKPIEHFYFLAVDRHQEWKGVQVLAVGHTIFNIIKGGCEGDHQFILDSSFTPPHVHGSCFEAIQRKRDRFLWGVPRLYDRFVRWAGWRKQLDLSPFSITHGRDLFITHGRKGDAFSYHAFGTYPHYEGHFTEHSPLGIPEQIEEWVANRPVIEAPFQADIQEAYTILSPQFSDLILDLKLYEAKKPQPLFEEV